MKMIMNQKIRINYLFFAIWFLFLMVLSFLQFQFVKNRPLFFFESFFQSLFEISLATLLLAFFNRRVKLLSGIFFVVLLARAVHFMTIMLLDTSIIYPIKMIFANGSIITNLKAANIDNIYLILITGALILTPFLGYLLYLFTLKCTKGIFLKKKSVVIMFLLICALCISLNLLSSSIITKENWSSYRKRLPYNFSLLSKFQRNRSALSFNFDEKKIENLSYSSINTHPIFLFIIESLRKDFIDEKISPNLFEFKEQNISFQNSFANANATQLSWFSIFYSLYPINWNHYQSDQGSIALKIMKKLNYDINIFSSADLAYFDMKKKIFGKDDQLIDKGFFFEDKNPAIRDKMAFEKLKETISDKKNDLFIIFLDSTHSEYSWPDDFEIKFKPISSVNYLTLPFSSKELISIKNRYCNAINYLDSLFANFFTFLKQNNYWDDATIIITGDHGEEFFEDGALFHGTHLNKYQLSIPIFYKIANQDLVNNIDRDKIVSLVDIFPTIFHTLLGSDLFEKILDGQSIFNRNKNHCLSALQNGPNDPELMTIIDPTKNISSDLELLEITR